MIVHQPHNSLGNYSYNAFFYDDCQWFYHFHNNYELVYVLSGQVVLTRNGQEFVLQPDTYALVLPNEFHGYRTPQTSRAWIGVFSRDFVEDFDRMVVGRQADDPRFTCGGALGDYLRTALITQQPPELMTMKGLLYSACSAFLGQTRLTEKAQGQDFLHDVMTYLRDHFREPITFVQLAESLGYEYHYLSRRFHRQFDTSFRSLLNRYRLDYAREQLQTTNHSITHIALDAGFQTVRTFNRAFLEQQGVTPSEFRKKAPSLRLQQQRADGSFAYAEGY